jgi:hypothetical protein
MSVTGLDPDAVRVRESLGGAGTHPQTLPRNRPFYVRRAAGCG